MTAKQKSNVKGVTWDKSRNKWELKVGGKRVGRYKNLHEAIEAKNTFHPDKPNYRRAVDIVARIDELEEIDFNLLAAILESQKILLSRQMDFSPPQQKVNSTSHLKNKPRQTVDISR